MAIESTWLELGTEAPQFSLTDVVSGETVEKSSFDGMPLLVMFVSVHCPYVKHLEREFAHLGSDYDDEPIGIVAICANDPERYPADGPDGMREQATHNGWLFPYLHDASQEVARSYTAACTPDFFLYDKEHRLVYRGQFDASRPGNDIPVSGEHLRHAIDLVLSGGEPLEEQRPSVGCSIKWREPVTG